MFNRVTIVLAALLCYLPLAAQQVQIYPSNWWVGMKKKQVQLLLRGDQFDAVNAQVTVQYPGVTLNGTHTFENNRYLAVDITIADNAQPGLVPIKYQYKKKTYTLQWPLEARVGKPGQTHAVGVTSKDVIYFLMPDRFSNGDPSNDKVPGLRDQSLNRQEIYDRHGGDFQGIINHLDYLQSLGVTALWTTPVLENDMPNRTEHGYAITNHYKVDARYGGEKMYRQLSDELHKRGMKLIQDAVYNHMGSYNFLVKDIPSKDWLNQWPTFTKTNAKDQTLFDPYAAPSDTKLMSDGWFVPEMPDWNQKNPFVANYIIQHAIWYVEKFGVDGIRIDTYIYNDLPFSNDCNAALEAEFPNITLYGEAWVNGTANQAFFAQNNIQTAFKSNLQGVVDFQLLFSGIIPALTQDFGWNTGVNQLYATLSNDFLYKDPTRNVLFLDNHDYNRFFSTVKGDVAKQKIAYQWLLTYRGIPQLYYGSEILMKGETNPDGWVRLDFPGGWAGDTVNAFTGKGLTDDQLSMQTMVKQLGQFRLRATALQTGKLMQYVPKEGLYVYFRYDDQQTVMCVMNTNKNARPVEFARYVDRIGGFKTARNVLTNEKINIDSDRQIPGMTMWVLELEK
ncbi:glycosidase [Chitinophaga skermanii]|uniref:Glycosidase n=1 Tax=Chitinophaga skermanii TaxID=331697 RepID=A0A327QVY0_9BACT|nr:alpha-amylase family glycosyl hydrolase [Chitinophaga skermanii]RAJ08826.1 glycosidase [Chitinophaga skermanii]